MIAAKRGHIVTIASMAGIMGVPGLVDYCASKFGAVAIDESLRLELQQKGLHSFIKTTCICPYFISTGMFEGAKSAFPMYILSPTEVADRIIAAIRQEEPSVLIPWRGNLALYVRLLPTWLQDKSGQLLGLHNQMSDFKGKGDITKRIPGIGGH